LGESLSEPEEFSSFIKLELFKQIYYVFRRQKKALEALEKDNFQDDVPTSGIYVSDYRLQLNKKLQQRFSVAETSDPSDSTIDSSQFINTGLSNENESNKKKKLKSESKLRFRKTFAALLEEEVFILFIIYYLFHLVSYFLNKFRFIKRELASETRFNYFSINVQPSAFPPRKFCSVCGFDCTYTCVQCGTKYCSTKCLQTHKDTRCLKWTA
jgi:zinc finger HIT domain-containing protein 1